MGTNEGNVSALGAGGLQRGVGPEPPAQVFSGTVPVLLWVLRPWSGFLNGTFARRIQTAAVLGT